MAVFSANEIRTFFLMAKKIKFFFAPTKVQNYKKIIIHIYPRFSGHSAQRKIADVETKNLEKQPKAKNNNIAKHSKIKSDDLKKKKTEIFSNGGVAGSKRSAAASEQRRKNGSHSSTDNNVIQTLNVNDVPSTKKSSNENSTKKKKKTDHIGDSHLKSINGFVLKCELVVLF